MSEKNIIAVTGITGKSGRFFLNRLIAEAENLQNYRFLLLCRTAPKELLEKAAKAIDVSFVESDLKDQESVRAAFVNRVDMVVHIAGVKLSYGLVCAAMEAGVDNFILVHTTGIYSKYKAAGEEYRIIEKKIAQMTEQYIDQGRNVAVTILRPTMIYGDLRDKNLSVFIRMVHKLRLMPVVNGARYDLQPVWCKDLGDAYYGVMRNWDVTKNKEYILSGGAPIQLREMFREIARQLGVKNVFISCPFPVAYAGAWALYLVSFGKINMREKVQRLVEPRAFEHTKATEDFGYAPVEFAEGIRQEIQMYKEQMMVEKNT